MTSSSRPGFRPRSASRMPEDSSWNTPNVFASLSMAYVLASSSGNASKSISMPRDCLRSLAVLASTVSVRSPRKSIFSRPSFSIGPIA